MDKVHRGNVDGQHQMHVILKDILREVIEVKRIMNKSETSGLKFNVMKVIMCANVISLFICVVVFFCGLT